MRTGGTANTGVRTQSRSRARVEPRVAWLAAALAFVPTAALAAEGGGGIGDLLWPTVNFVLLLGVIGYFAGKPIKQFFEDRRDQIQDDVKTAADLCSEAERKYAEWNRRLVDLDTELAKIRAGASLIQLYSGLVYQGPGLIFRIKADLAACLRRDGWSSLAAAVGADRA